jgi:hypothetical protein
MSDSVHKIAQTLEINPRKNFRAFMIAVRTLGEFLSSAGRWDLLNLLFSAAEWAALHPAGAPRLPGMPATPGPFASQHEITQFKWDRDSHIGALDAAKKFKAAIIVGLGTDIASEIAHPIYGHMQLEVHDIVTSTTERYGTLNAQAIAEIVADNAVWRIDSTFVANCTRMKANYILLAHAIPIGEHQQFLELEKACSCDPLIDSIMVDFVKANVDVEEQTFARAQTFIERQLKGQRPSAGARVNSAAAAAAAAAVAPAAAAGLSDAAEARIMAHLNSSFASLAAAQATNSGGTGDGGTGGGGRSGGGRSGGGRGRGGGRAQGGRGAGGGGTGQHFCFYHGSNSPHAGPGCLNMRHAPAGFFTANQINATRPGIYDNKQSAD